MRYASYCFCLFDKTDDMLLTTPSGEVFAIFTTRPIAEKQGKLFTQLTGKGYRIERMRLDDLSAFILSFAPKTSKS